MAEVSLYIAVRSKTGNSHTVNKTNIFIDGKYSSQQQMTAGYENQFSCRKGMIGIAEGTGEGTAASDAARTVWEQLQDYQKREGLFSSREQAQSVAGKILDKARPVISEGCKTNLSLFSVHQDRLILCGAGDMPVFLLRRHSMKPLPQSGGNEVYCDELELQDKDRLLICTREVVDFVEPAMFQTILEGRGEPNQIAGDLVHEAMKNGAKRDVTVAVIICDAVQETQNIPAITTPEEEEDEGVEEYLSRPVAWFENKKLVGLAALAAVCVIAAGSVTLATVLRKRGTVPANAGESQSQSVMADVSESGFSAAPITTEETETQETEPETEERTTRERTTAPRTTENRTTTTKGTTKPSEPPRSTNSENSGDISAPEKPTGNQGGEDGSEPSEE